MNPAEPVNCIRRQRQGRPQKHQRQGRAEEEEATERAAGRRAGEASPPLGHRVAGGRGQVLWDRTTGAEGRRAARRGTGQGRDQRRGRGPRPRRAGPQARHSGAAEEVTERHRCGHLGQPTTALQVDHRQVPGRDQDDKQEGAGVMKRGRGRFYLMLLSPPSLMYVFLTILETALIRCHDQCCFRDGVYQSLYQPTITDTPRDHHDVRRRDSRGHVVEEVRS